MNRRHLFYLFVGVIVLGAIVLTHGQQPLSAVDQAEISARQVPAAVPPFLPFSGVLVDRSGKPIAGPLEITLAVYAEREGGTPLWSEVQTIQADQRGQYTLTLGAASSNGIPVSVFATGGVRWLGVSPAGQDELARTPILSVPYALKAGDAETLGGKPASAFLTATPDQGRAAATPSSSSASDAPSGPMAPSPAAPTFTATANPGPGFISQATSGPPLQVSSSAAVANLNADLLDGFHAAAFPKLSTPNTFSGTQTASSSSSPVALQGLFTAPSLSGIGVFGRTSSNAGGAGVYGLADAASGVGSINGVLGETTGLVGAAVRGLARHQFGTGVDGLAAGTNGVGVLAQAPASSGTSTALLANVNSPTATTALLQSAGGDLIVGRNNGPGLPQRFRVDGNGAVFATSYRDLNGNVVGTGDITGVAAGAGLLGGGTSGDVGLSLDTAFTNSTYARLAAANTFNGNQSITGDMTASGRVAGNTGRFSASSGTTETLRSEISATGGYAIIGLASPGVGQTGTGVFGWLIGQSGDALLGEASASTGNTVGVHGRAQSASGVGGLFENTAGGDLLRAQTIPGATKFRVDSAGLVYAAEYRDLNGTPIPSGTGDITGVAAGSGLSGGGASGDVTLNLNTAFTDARYAQLGPNTFSGTQTAPAFVGDGAAITNVAKLGANTFSATQTIDTGNLDLDPSTATTGNITKNGAPFLHNFGTDNTFLGVNAGNVTMTGQSNTATGRDALASNTTGNQNTASGTHALEHNTTGLQNTASGENALRGNTSGSQNTASGISALQFSGTGSRNTATGVSALIQNAAGNDNVALGHNAGFNASNGSSNIYLGANVLGTAGESNTIYLGNQGTQTKTVIAGIRGTTVTGGEAVLIDANGRLGSGSVAPASNSVGSAEVIDDSLTANDLGPDSVTASELAPDSVTAAKVAFNFAGSASEGGAAADLACVGCVAASEVSFSFASLGANTFTATQTIDTGNLDLDPSTATVGNITKNGAPFLHNFGTDNTFLGVNAGNVTMTGNNNTAGGSMALRNNGNGSFNTASGYQALVSNTSGTYNTASGVNSLLSNTSGQGNVAIGKSAGASTTTGSNNTYVGTDAGANATGSSNVAVGERAGENAASGSSNVFLGLRAGESLTSGSNNIYLGTSVHGAPVESDTMYLGSTQTKTVIAGVRGTTVTGGEAVLIDANGRLGSGTVSPGANSVGSTQVIDDSLTASDLGPDSVSTSELAADAVTAAKVAFNYAGSASEGGAAADLACVGCVAASEVSFSFAALGANTFTATQTIDTGNIDLDPSSATTGNITKNGSPFLHNFGTNNTFLGISAGNVTTTGSGNNVAVGFRALQTNTSGFDNVATGQQALRSNTTGGLNTASGSETLSNNTTGFGNTAVGAQALRGNISGGSNTAMGSGALSVNTTGNQNTGSGAGALNHTTDGHDNTATGVAALGGNISGFNNTAEGSFALFGNTTGNSNVAVGALSGLNATTGSNNVYLGANIPGVAGESNAIYLGIQGTQTKTVIAGIRGTTVTAGEAVLIDANGRLGSGTVAPGSNSVGSAEVIDDSLTASDLGPDSVNSSELAPDSVTAAKVAFNYAGSASEGGAATDLACAGCVAANEVSFSFASLGANTFTATQTLDTANIDLDPSTATTGNITKNGQRFLHNFGTNNTFVGVNAGNTSMTGFGKNTGFGTSAFQSNTIGDSNTAIGYQTLVFNTEGNLNTATGTNALFKNTTGGGNTASGAFAMNFNTTGDSNTATGYFSLSSNLTGSQNTAFGASSLESNSAGSGNTAIGINALRNNTGGNNVGLGRQAGVAATNGSYNIYLGTDVLGVAGESNTMYLGKVGTQTKTIVAGIRGITTVNADAISVMIDSSGQLGTVSSSRRFKEDIHAMGDTSRRLLQLRPVTFRYKQAFGDGSKPIQYGLVAEEVAEVFPELAVRSADGTVETVHYETLNVLLLNELQKQQTEMQRQQQRIDALEQRLNELIGSRQTNTVRQ